MTREEILAVDLDAVARTRKRDREGPTEREVWYEEAMRKEHGIEAHARQIFAQRMITPVRAFGLAEEFDRYRRERLAIIEKNLGPKT